jgi:hypothetical protein
MGTSSVFPTGTYDDGDAGVHADRDFGKMPLYFIENQGQLPKDVDFYVQGSDKTLYFTPQGVTFALAGKKAEGEETQRWSIKLEFVGANADVRPRGGGRQQAVISYFKGKPEDWKSGVATYSRVVYPDLWDGIDLVYSGSVNKLKYEFVVKPDADPKQIRLAYRGASDVSVKETGELIVETPLGGFADGVPYAYQEMDGRRAAVSMTYTLEQGSSKGIFEYGFDIGPYDTSRPLVLDPAVLIYCGYIGGADADSSYGIAVDAAGCAYVTGFTWSWLGFPVAVGPALYHLGNRDAFVAKVNTDGSALLYCGYIGGTSRDYGLGIAVDAAGCAYVMGYTWSSVGFPVAVGPDLTHNGGNGDTFVAKVNAAGTGLDYCGYIGGTGDDEGSGIAVDASGCAYMTGLTYSTEASFPVAVGPDITFNGGSIDGFVAKVNAAGTGLDYCGYIGGADYDQGRGIAVDTSGNAYVTGYTYSTEAESFPVVVGPDLTGNGGSYDAFVAKVNAAGTGLDYCGYIGGTSSERGWGIAVDAAGCAYVTGDTNSSEASFPVVVGPDLSYNVGTWDAFVAKVKAVPTDGAGPLIYCGYIGGTDSERAEGIAVDLAGCAYVTGYTNSSEVSFPVVVGPDLTYNGGNDGFVAKVNAAGAGLDYCGYIGGTSNEGGSGIAVDAAGSAYVTGTTLSTQASFPVIVGPDLTHNGGATDAFVAKISYWICSNQPQYDYNDDCLVTLADLMDFCGHWLEPGADPKYDTSGDGKVNLEDFAGLAAIWLECGRLPASGCP